MNHKLSAAIFTVIFTLSAMPSLAADASPTVTPPPAAGWFQGLFQVRNEIRNENRENRQEIINTANKQRNDLKATGAQNRENLKVTAAQGQLQRHRNRVRTSYFGLYNSFTKRIEALNRYQIRIQDRLNIKKVELPNNQNLTNSQAALDNVTNVLKTKFNTDLAAFKAKADQIIASEDPKSLVPQLKTAAQVVNTDLKNIRLKLVEALRLMVTAK